MHTSSVAFGDSSDRAVPFVTFGDISPHSGEL